MSDNTCFKFLIADASWDGIRDHLQSFGSLFQVFIPRDSPNIVYAKYKHASSANHAKTALANDERVVSVEPMDKWPFEKKQKSKSSANTSSDSGECPEININIPLRKPLECHKCGAYADLLCSVCSAWYCSEQCQLLDWHDHIKNCIPRLIRASPLLTSLQNMAIKNTQQLQAQQQKAKQMQLAPQQQLAQQVQQQQQQAQQKQQQQQQRAQHQQQAQQLHMNEQLRKEKESGLNVEKRFSPNGANQTELSKRQPDRPMEQARANGVQQKAKDDLNKKKPNSSENPDKANYHYIPADKHDANVVKPAPQETKKRLSPEKSQLKEQQNNTKQVAQSVSPNKSDDQSLKKQPSQAAVATNVALNGPNRATQGLVKSEQPGGGSTNAPKVADDPPKAAQGPSFLQKRMQALATAKRTIAYGAFPAVGSKVAISVVSDKTLYIHEISDDLNDPFMSLIKSCILHASEIKQQLQQPPAVGDIVFAPFDDNYYRAIVKKCEGDSAVVMFPDFGNSQPIHWKLLKEIRDANVKYATCMTHAVSLFAEGPFSPAIHNFLTDLIEEEKFELTRVEANPTGGVRKVELRHLESKYILSAKVRELAANDAAVRAKQAEPAQKGSKLMATDPATYKPVHSTEFKDSCIPNDGYKEEELTIVEASEFTDTQIVSVILASKQRPFAKILKECEEYGRLDPNEYLGEPERNYGCLVRYDETWSRAIKVASDTNDQYYLLDFGIIRGLDKIDAVRRFPPALSRELFCAEYVVDNPEMLTKLMKESDNSTDALRGRSVKAKLCVDQETELFHMKIVSISG